MIQYTGQVVNTYFEKRRLPMRQSSFSIFQMLSSAYQMVFIIVR